MAKCKRCMLRKRKKKEEKRKKMGKSWDSAKKKYHKSYHDRRYNTVSLVVISSNGRSITLVIGLFGIIIQYIHWNIIYC